MLRTTQEPKGPVLGVGIVLDRGSHRMRDY